MNIEIIDDKIYIKNMQNFDLEQTLDCGQAFRWSKDGNSVWSGIAFGRYIKLWHDGDDIIISGSSGMGIRRIIDIYYLNEKILPDLDIKFTYDFLENIGCKKDYEILSEIAKSWFSDNDIECKFNHEKNKIFMSGTHGDPNVSILNEYEREEQKHIFKIKKFVKLIFPPKTNIYSAYSFCSEKRLPIVFCWIYRWWILTFSKSKRKRVFKTIKKIKDFKVKKSQS